MSKLRKSSLIGIVLLLSAGCTFFEQPVTDLRDLTLSAPTNESSNQPTAPAPTPAPLVTPTPAATTAPTAPVIAPAGSSFLIVAPIENLPEAASNVAVVHFTRKDTERALALCKVLIQNLQIIDVQELPQTPTNVALWPVANDNAGGNCIEMLTDYEPIDITVEAAKKVNDSSEGPFLLTQHMNSGKRMIYDMSFVTRGALNAAVGEWKSLMGSDAANWPAYRRAR